MFCYTTCRSCRHPLLLGCAPITNPCFWHETCEARLTKYERIEADLLEILTSGHSAESPEAYRGNDLLEQLNDMDDAPPRLMEAALQYASWGWPVFPLVEGDKAPAIKKGLHAATVDEAPIRAFWERRPMCNIGVATGHRFDVIDIDVAKRGEPPGWDAYGKMLQQVDPQTGRGPLPDCYGHQMTPSGGAHLLILPTGGGNRAGLLPGIDTRGLGGYIVAAPSVIDERRYKWWIPPAPQVCGSG